MKLIKIAAIAVLALAASAFTFAPSAMAAKAPARACISNCGATIKITGASVSTAPGYYPTPAGPVISAIATAKFTKTGTDVTDFRLLVDGKLAPEYDTAFGSGSVGVVYGTYATGMDTNQLSFFGGISGLGFPVKPGTHVLTYEILGVNSSVLATSAAYNVTVPKQPAAAKPTLTYKASTPYSNQAQISISSSATATLDATPGVLIFTLPPRGNC